jgi:hypothetical protein
MLEVEVIMCDELRGSWYDAVQSKDAVNERRDSRCRFALAVGSSCLSVVSL